MSSRMIIRLLVAVMMLLPAIPAMAMAQTDGEVIVASDNFDDPSAGILQEGSDDPDLRFDYDDDGYEIDAFASDFSGDLTVPVPGEFPNGTIQIDAALTGKNDGNGHYLFLVLPGAGRDWLQAGNSPAGPGRCDLAPESRWERAHRQCRTRRRTPLRVRSQLPSAVSATS